ncbi:MAG: diaminopimelate epimerase [Candidatus Aminicenantes bacterium]|nr:diaminopimelate epimerase [Candidatus Aminicenantes bacterium]
MIFYKTSSFGNDFIEIDENDLPAPGADKRFLVKDICARYRAVGADGVVFYRLADDGIHFQIHNRDGGEAELSGNGMAGLAAVLFERRLASSPLLLLTRSGPRQVAWLGRDGPVFQLRVEIGAPDFFDLRSFPFLKEKQDRYAVAGLEFYPVSVGNPHAVVICPEEPAVETLPALGEKLAHDRHFPFQVNVEFVHVTAPNSCHVFFYERGVGPTQASSTGSAAVFAVLRRLGRVQDSLAIDCGAERIAVSWQQGIFIHNVTRLICRGEYFQ